MASSKKESTPRGEQAPPAPTGRDRRVPATVPVLQEASRVLLESEVDARTAALQAALTDLRVSETILQQLPDAVIVTDLSGKVQRWVGRAAVIFGYDEAEMLGRSVEGLLRPQDRGIHQSSILPALRSSGSFTGELRCLRKDGTELDTELVSKVVLDGRGQHMAVVGIYRDVSERKRSEQDRLRLAEEQSARAQAEQSERQIRRVAESIPQMVFAADAAGRGDYRNERWVAYTGRGPDFAPDNSWAQLAHPDEAAAVLALWTESIQKGEPFETELRLRAADGTYRWQLARALPVRDVKGNIVRWFGTCTDIEGAKRAADAQRFLSEVSSVMAASLDFRTTMEHLARLAVPRLGEWCLIDTVQADGSLGLLAAAHPDPEKVKEVRLHRQRYPLPPDLSTGAPLVLRTGKTEFLRDVPLSVLELISGGNAAALAELKSLGVRSSVVVPLMARGQALGAMTLLYTDPRRPQAGPTDVALAESFAQRASAFLENAILYKEAQDAVALRDEFLSVASHELKTPLTPLSLQLQRLERNFTADPSGFSVDKVLKDLAMARRQVKKMSDLVEGLMDVSRITAGKLQINLEPVDLSEVVREQLANTEAQAARSGCALEARVSPGIWGTWDPLRLEQVVANLLSNAIKYGAGKPIQIELWQEGPTALLAVTDHGIGIEESQRARIFGRFERAVSEKHYGGLGLGLYITRQILQALGGTISVMSRVGAGSTFTVRLPLQPPSEAAAHP